MVKAGESLALRHFERMSEMASEKRTAREPSPEADLAGPAQQDRDLGRLTADLPCAHCGYNLRGLPPEGKCPECGTAIAESLRGDLLSAADPAWLQRIYRGQALIYAGKVGLIFVFVFVRSSLLRAAWPAWGPVGEILGWVITGATSLLLLLGTFAATTLDPRLSLTEQPIALRRFVRGSIVALVALVICSYLVPPVLKQLGGDAKVAALCGTVFEGAGVVAFLCGLVGICYYLSGLAMRIPDSKLASRTKTRVFRFLVCVGIVIAAGVVRLCTGAPLNGVRTGVFQGILVFLGVILGVIGELVAMGYIVLLMSLMSAYRKAFRKCLLEARKHATA